MIFLFAESLAVAAGALKTIRITNGEWPPYLGEQLPGYGIASKIITEAFAESGFKVEYGFFPWHRSLELAKTGEWDGTAVWFKTSERQEIFYFTDPVIDSSYVFFHLKKFAFHWKTLDDLKGIEIGATRDYAYGDAFSNAEKSGLLTVYWANGDEINLRHLLAGQIQIFPLDKIVGYDMIRRLFDPTVAEEFAYDPLPLKSDYGYLLLSKSNPANKDLVSAFNRGLLKLKNSGRYDKIIRIAIGNK